MSLHQPHSVRESSQEDVSHEEYDRAEDGTKHEEQQQHQHHVEPIHAFTGIVALEGHE